MRVQQVHDVVSWSAEYHAALAEEYGKFVAVACDERVRLILDYLVSHEREIEKGLRQYLETAPPGLMATWSRSGPNLKHPKLLEELKSSLCCTSVAEITGLAVRIHSTLGNMYDELVQSAELDEQRELLTALRDHEGAETRRMVRDIGSFEDC